VGLDGRQRLASVGSCGPAHLAVGAASVAVVQRVAYPRRPVGELGVRGAGLVGLVVRIELMMGRERGRGRRGRRHGWGLLAASVVWRRGAAASASGRVEHVAAGGGRRVGSRNWVRPLGGSAAVSVLRAAGYAGRREAASTRAVVEGVRTASQAAIGGTWALQGSRTGSLGTAVHSRKNDGRWSCQSGCNRVRCVGRRRPEITCGVRVRAQSTSGSSPRSNDGRVFAPSTRLYFRLLQP
jgi:hypothetical protein